MGIYRTQLATFTEDSLPDLDEVTLGALELLAEEVSLPHAPLSQHACPLVVGSVNALATGTMLFAKTNARFADESSFEAVLAKDAQIDAVVVISASGSKHAIAVVEASRAKGLPVYLLTNTKNAPAAAELSGDAVFVFPKNREPYSYNTSTYLSLLQSVTNEDVVAIAEHLTTVVAPVLQERSLQSPAYTFILPTEFTAVCSMVRVKFDELFGPMVVGRAFTSEEVKHAKTIVHHDEELFVSIGAPNTWYGKPEQRLFIPLPPNPSYVAAIATAYFVVGYIQRAHPQYFKQGIAEYTKQLQEVFGKPFSVIVE